MNILVLGLGSYQVKDSTGYDPDNFDRQLLYTIAIDRLCKVAPEGVKIQIVENTVSDLATLHEPLREALAHARLEPVLWAQNNALGAKNKGAGEYGMCLFVKEQRQDLFDWADWVIYYTHRHTMPFPYVFDHIRNFHHADAIVSCADYLLASGGVLMAGQEVFDDVIFAMKKDIFLRYIDSMNPEELVKKRMGSEQNLYNFLTKGSFDFKQVEHFGVFRYDYKTYQMQVI